jgi:hypothetical protein
MLQRKTAETTTAPHRTAPHRIHGDDDDDDHRRDTHTVNHGAHSRFQHGDRGCGGRPE